MSGKPCEDGIHSLRLTLDRLSVIDAEAEVLRAELAERNRRLADLQAEHSGLAERVPMMLRAMDIASSGNFGWEPRIVWALRELARQYRSGTTR